MEEEEFCIVCHKNECVDWCFWCQECLDKEDMELIKATSANASHA